MVAAHPREAEFSESLTCSRLVVAGIMMPTQPTIIELDMNNLEDVLRRAEAKLDEKDYALLKALADSYAYLTDLVGDKNTSIARLRKLLFGAKTEKTAAVVGRGKESEAAPSPDNQAEPARESDAERGAENDPAQACQGHGRNGADAYIGAERIEIPHESLQPGDACPECRQGTVYETDRPGVLVRIVGQAPVQARVYRLQKLRCNLCGKVFTARAAGGSWHGEVRRDRRQHDCAFEVRQRDALQPNGAAARECGHSLASLDPMGHCSCPGGARRAGL